MWLWIAIKLLCLPAEIIGAYASAAIDMLQEERAARLFERAMGEIEREEVGEYTPADAVAEARKAAGVE